MSGYFPFFVDLTGLNGLLVGGGEVALRKARVLLPFSPRLTVSAPRIHPDLRSLPGIDFLERPFAPPDLAGRAFVVAATDDRAANRQIARLCRERGIPVNAVDDREESSFLFPALLRRGALTVGVSTGGASPAAAALLRDRMAEILPEGLEEILDFLGEARRAVREAVSDSAARGRLLTALTAECVALGRPLSREALLERLDRAGRGEAP